MVPAKKQVINPSADASKTVLMLKNDGEESSGQSTRFNDTGIISCCIIDACIAYVFLLKRSYSNEELFLKTALGGSLQAPCLECVSNYF